jgi:hypothetical protein
MKIGLGFKGNCRVIKPNEEKEAHQRIFMRNRSYLTWRRREK